MNNPLTRSTAAIVLAVTSIIAAQHIIYAKKLPGEGFTAGALMMLALLLCYLVLGYPQARKRFPPRAFYFGFLLGGGALLSLIIGPALAGHPALTTFDTKVLGVEVGSMLLFDIALFLITVCSLMLAINSLRETLP